MGGEGAKWRKAALRIRGGGGGNVLAAIECHGEYEGGGMGSDVVPEGGEARVFWVRGAEFSAALAELERRGRLRPIISMGWGRLWRSVLRATPYSVKKKSTTSGV